MSVIFWVLIQTTNLKQLRGSWEKGNINWKCDDKIWLKIDDTNIIMMMILRYDNYIEGIFLKSPYLLKAHITILRDKNLMELSISLF